MDVKTATKDFIALDLQKSPPNFLAHKAVMA